jgi:hypothetical protein
MKAAQPGESRGEWHVGKAGAFRAEGPVHLPGQHDEVSRVARYKPDSDMPLVQFAFGRPRCMRRA